MSRTHVEDHIRLIARHEEEFLANRTPSEKVTDAIAVFIGSVPYVLLHIALYAFWIIWNLLPVTHHFDPRPFGLLQTMVAMEAIPVASFILMRQSRLGRRAEERDHLMLQLLLLSERETTTLLNVNREIANEVGLGGVANSPEIRDLSQHISIDDVAQTIKESLPNS